MGEQEKKTVAEIRQAGAEKGSKQSLIIQLLALPAIPIFAFIDSKYLLDFQFHPWTYPVLLAIFAGMRPETFAEIFTGELLERLRGKGAAEK